MGLPGAKVFDGRVDVGVGDHHSGAIHPDGFVIAEPHVGDQIDRGHKPQRLSLFERLDLDLGLGNGVYAGLADGLGVGVGDEELDCLLMNGFLAYVALQ